MAEPVVLDEIVFGFAGAEQAVPPAPPADWSSTFAMLMMVMMVGMVGSLIGGGG